MRRILRWAIWLSVLPLLAAVCEPASEPDRVVLPVVADGRGISAFRNAEGYDIDLSACRVAIRDLEFTIAGETHAGLGERLRRLLVPVARAHPGHYAGGEVTGELPGRFLVDFFSGADRMLGDGTLLEGDYHGLNFSFRAADAADGIGADDPILGHTAHLAGIARRGTDTWAFDAVLDIEEGTKMVGGPFTLALRAGMSPTLVLRLLAVDPSTEADTLFDGIDFATLDADGDGVVTIRPGDAAHNILRRRLQVHDHWWLDVRN